MIKFNSKRQLRKNGFDRKSFCPCHEWSPDYMYPSSIFLCTIVQLIFTKWQDSFYLIVLHSFCFMFRAVSWSVSDSDEAPPSLKKLTILFATFFYFKFVEYEHCSDVQKMSFYCCNVQMPFYSCISIYRTRKKKLKEGNFLVHGCVSLEPMCQTAVWRRVLTFIFSHSDILRMTRSVVSSVWFQSSSFILWTHNVTLLV